MDEAPVGEMPYPMAKRLRAEGVDDAAIVAALVRSGVSDEDAKFVVGSLPGGALDVGLGGAPPPLQSTDAPKSGGFPIGGVTMIVAGVGLTLFSYMTPSAGGRYYIWWGLIVVGIIRLLQGR